MLIHYIESNKQVWVCLNPNGNDPFKEQPWDYRIDTKRKKWLVYGGRMYDKKIDISEVPEFVVLAIKIGAYTSQGF